MCWTNTTDTWSVSLSSVTAWQTSTLRSWNSWVNNAPLMIHSFQKTSLLCGFVAICLCLPVYLVNGKFERALEVLQLTLKLLSASAREELRRLLEFMSTAAEAANVQLHKEVSSPNACDVLFINLSTIYTCFGFSDWKSNGCEEDVHQSRHPEQESDERKDRPADALHARQPPGDLQGFFYLMN